MADALALIPGPARPTAHPPQIPTKPPVLSICVASAAFCSMSEFLAFVMRNVAVDERADSDLHATLKALLCAWPE